MSESLLVCELFRSIQGESTYAGTVCSFVRLAGCNLECHYCDTSYARSGGILMTIASIVEKICGFGTGLIEITGGEPLLQQGTSALIRDFLERKKTVLMETNGSLDIGVVPNGCIRIVDVKCPSSGMQHSFLERNIAELKRDDEVKFVIGSREDFDFSLAFIGKHSLEKRAILLMSPVTGMLPSSDLAQWILDSNVPVRLQLQLHKILWGDRRGV
ncbi:MAG: radical SAM protein [Chitinispirillaceae bacterium]|nr:radical SAM protein [Chitinispirillaceae bacterium]